MGSVLEDDAVDGDEVDRVYAELLLLLKGFMLLPLHMLELRCDDVGDSNVASCYGHCW